MIYAGDAPGEVEGVVQINCRIEGRNSGAVTVLNSWVDDFFTPAPNAYGINYQIYVAK